MAFSYGYVNLEELLDWVRTHRLPDGRSVPVCIWGAAGTAKTSMVKAYAAAREIDVITYHPAHDTDGADVVGMSYIDRETGKTTYAHPSWLPMETGRGGIIFIDEINRARLEVIQGLMEVIGEGTISQSGWRLPDEWSIVCAANPAGRDYNVASLDSAMINRMLHYAPGWNSPGWTRWAEESGLHSTIIDFALQNPDMVAAGDTDLPYEVQPLASPRALEYLGALYAPDMELRMLETCATGLVGPALRDRTRPACRFA